MAHMAGAMNKWLLAYSVVMTTGLALSGIGQAVSAPTRSSFDEIDVKRINLREDDGTLRMVLSNTSHFPGIIVRGKERPHPGRRTAGMLFFNEEGTENGGLTFGGRKDKDGKVEASGHLAFDQYEQDQVITFSQAEHNGRRSAALRVLDRPNRSIEEEIAAGERLAKMPDGPEKTAEIQRLRAEGAGGRSRLVVGKEDGMSVVALQDAAGRPRLLMKVMPEGAASIEFLDENGRSLRKLTPEDTK
jgi:hypothetical protein